MSSTNFRSLVQKVAEGKKLFYELGWKEGKKIRKKKKNRPSLTPPSLIRCRVLSLLIGLSVSSPRLLASD